MQKKLDQEQNEMSAFDDIAKRAKGSGLVNEQFFYG